MNIFSCCWLVRDLCSSSATWWTSGSVFNTELLFVSSAEFNFCCFSCVHVISYLTSCDLLWPALTSCDLCVSSDSVTRHLLFKLQCNHLRQTQCYSHIPDCSGERGRVVWGCVCVWGGVITVCCRHCLFLLLRCVSCLSTKWKCFWDQENHRCVSSKEESKNKLLEVRNQEDLGPADQSRPVHTSALLVWTGLWLGLRPTVTSNSP